MRGASAHVKCATHVRLIKIVHLVIQKRCCIIIKLLPIIRGPKDVTWLSILIMRIKQKSCLQPWWKEIVFKKILEIFSRTQLKGISSQKIKWKKKLQRDKIQLSRTTLAKNRNYMVLSIFLVFFSKLGRYKTINQNILFK